MADNEKRERRCRYKWRYPLSFPIVYKMKDKEIIFGIRAVIEAVEAGKDIDKVLVKRGLSGELFQELLEVLRLHEIPVQRVPVERIDRVTRKNHQRSYSFSA